MIELNYDQLKMLRNHLSFVKQYVPYQERGDMPFHATVWYDYHQDLLDKVTNELKNMSTELKDWLNSINLSKKNLIDEDPSLEKEYPAYIVNRCFSGHLDAIMFANEMNMNPLLQKETSI